MSEIATPPGTCPAQALDVPALDPLPAGAVPQLTCYQVDPRAAPIIPGRRERAWMDQTNEHYAYRCLPLSTATASHLEHMIFGALIVFFLIVEPHGLARLWLTAREKLRLWPFPH